MNWSTEDHHRHHQQQQNYYNNYQIVQQNGIPQATAAVPPQQQQQHPTPPPPLQQQPQNHHQHQQQQQQQSSHRTAQQIQTHYATNQQLQHQQFHQWTSRPQTLTGPPFMQQFTTTVPNSAQYCAAPQQFFHTPRVGQAVPSVSAPPPQQRPCLPQGCAMYQMPPQAAGLRQNVMPQQQSIIVTPTTSTAPQMQMQYFAPPFCHPPMAAPGYTHVIAQPEPPAVKQRKHAIPIIDPQTKENILERDLRSSESASPADTISLATTSSPTPTPTPDLKESENETNQEPNVPQSEASTELLDEAEQEKHEEDIEGVQQAAEDCPDHSAQPPAALDHVEPIEASEELKDEATTTNLQEIFQGNGDDEDDDQTQSISTTTETITNENIGSDDDDTSTAEGNLPPAVEEVPVESPSPSQSSSPKAAAATKANKQQQMQQKQPQPPQAATVTQATKPNSKKSKKNKRLKESQRKQQRDLLNNEKNNNTIKINQNESKIKPAQAAEPCTSNRLTVKAKDDTTKSIQTDAVECGDVENYTASPLDGERPKDDESTEKINDSTATSHTNDSSPQLTDSPQRSTSEQIASEILGIESAGNEILFLNSSMSGYEEDLCSSPGLQETPAEGNILFGDFSQENPVQEISTDECQLENENEDDDNDDVGEEEDSLKEENKKFAYSLQELKDMAHGPASKIPPAFRGKICEIIGKNPRSSAQSNQNPMMFQHMSFKDSLNLLSKKRNKRPNEMPTYQQFQQLQQQQQQFEQQRKPDIIRINLSLNEEIQLSKSENAWVPGGLQNRSAKTESDDDEQIVKKIRGILNRLTPENFDKLLKTASNFPMNGENRMKKVMLLIFEKTVSEPNFAPTYARFCKFLFNPENENHSTFKAILINRIQEEFEGNVNNAKAKNAKLRPIMDRLAVATDPKEQMEIKAELDDQEYQFRRRAWGTVRFIGEMFKLGFLSTKIVYSCVSNLLDPTCEEKLEYMCKLLTTVGAQLEPVDNYKQPSGEKTNKNERLDPVFNTIKMLVTKKKSSGQKISSRVRFMMQDVLDLRARSWDQKVSAVQPSRDASPAIMRVPPPVQRNQQRVGGNFQPPFGGYDRRRQPADGNKNSSQQNLDVNKLPKPIHTDESTISLGNSTLSMWKTAGRSQQQKSQQLQSSRFQSRPQETEQKESTPPQQPELSASECKRLITSLVEVAIEEPVKEEWFAKWKEIAPYHHPTLVCHLLTEYLASAKLSRVEVDACASLFVSLMKENLLTIMSFKEAYQRFGEICEEFLLDVPTGWTYNFHVLGPLLHFELLPFELIWDKKWHNTQVGEKFLQSLIKHFTSEFGANYMRYFWDGNSLHWETFIAEADVPAFVARNNFEFVENPKCHPPIFVQRSADELVQRIKTLLDQYDQNIDLIIDFLNTNVNIDCNFIRNLTMFLCDYTVIYCNTPNSSSISSNSSKKSKQPDASPSSPSASPARSSYRLREDFLEKKCIPLLRRCIDSKEDHELNCLDAIVERCRQLYESSAVDLICTMLDVLSGEVISNETVQKWQQQQLARSQGNEKLISDLNALFKRLPI